MTANLVNFLGTRMEKVIYWEKQDPKTKMCALHCLNSLLQGPLVTTDELCEISLLLDSEENRLLNGNFGYNGTVLGYGNVSDSGDFNLPVLQSALSIRNISCTHFSLSQLSLSMFQNNHSIGFICNIQSHWFSIRYLHHHWYILDSLRQGPVPIEPGPLYDYVKKNLETAAGVILLVVPTGTKLPEPDPLAYPAVQPNQFYVKLSDIEGANEGGGFGNSGVVQSGADAKKSDSSKVWPTTGGVRLDQAVDQPLHEDQEYTGPDAVKIAVKLSSSRIMRSFAPSSTINNLFEWVESNQKLDELDFYYLLQTVPYRKFIKYSNGSIETITSQSGPSDVTGRPLSALNFGANDMFMLRID
ncbi:hypothetical protein MACJ_000445 [Theileria orientalis]|uniref:ubiquitinyl hydrolase 1 n=1 Tax=Theileria orientalis TaxID=68886 RepID=A0A976QQG8_THEOR|nr:hypothetical protein MACJ_000445 [Theileria orientalis]